MQKFKVEVTKGGKHFTFIVSAGDENELKERIHKDGYSILNYEKIEESALNQNNGNTFIFEAEKDGEKKHGKVIGEDIFKIYIKLRKNLGYKVIKLFSIKDQNLLENQKQDIIKELEEEYNIYVENIEKQNKPKTKEEKKQEKETKIETNNFDNFYLKKELDETYKMIDFILNKLNDIINEKDIKNIDFEEKEKLKNIYVSIIKLKNTTNISKLKEIGELALLKIGNLEKKEIEKERNEKTKGLLRETNILLKKIGSKEQIKEIDYNLIIKDSFSDYINKIKSIFKRENVKKEKIDVSSYMFIKNALLLKKYKEKLDNNTKNIILNFFKIIFNSTFREDIFLRRNVIKQNILLLKAKNSGIKFSYTKIKKGYDGFIGILLNSFNNIRKILLYFIFIYIITFILLLNFYYYFKDFDNYFNYNGLFYFIITLIFYYILFLSRNFLTILINSGLLFFIILIGIINF